jgi:hypothetical protein
MSETDPNDYLDEYDWAGNIISWVINDLMEDVIDPKYDDIVEIIDEYMKMEYGPIMFEYYEDYFGGDDDLTESIKKIIEEEVSKKYAKPTPKVEQLVYRWLNNYFDGAQMYHNKSWESTHSFEFCNNGKEILHIVLYFNVDYSVYNDKRKTEERNLERGYLTIPKNVFEELSLDIPVRASYLKYLFEEWFDDTYLGEIQKFMGRNDIYIDEFDVTGNDAKTCVPPITKPEDVSDEDMIQYILKTTLFKKDDILKYENEEPGWIEKTYLEKLRGDEMERLRGQ